MAPSPAELRASLERYVDAVNGRDPDAIAGCFTEEALHADPVSNPPNVGREAIRAFFAAAIASSETWQFATPRVHTCADHVAADFEITVTTPGGTMQIAGIEIFAFDDAGLIRSAHAYWDDHDLTVG